LALQFVGRNEKHRLAPAFHLDRARLLSLADLAMTLTRRGGASYADIRIGETIREFIQARDGRLQDFSESAKRGFGLRVLVDGCWGFCGAAALDESAVRDAAQQALENAKAVRRIRSQPILLEELPAVESEWIMPMGVDPFEIAANLKADWLLGVNAAALDAGADYVVSSLTFAREERLFANSRGSRIFQARTRVHPFLAATAIDKASGRFATRESLTPARSGGWDYVLSCGLMEDAKRAAEDARRKIHAKPVTPGVRDLVIDPTNLWLTIHETVGHSTELDRALGWEANFAGTSFVKPNMLNCLQFGSGLMNVFADRSQEGGLSTLAFDDDGAPSELAAFPIIEKGVFRNYQMALGQSRLIGLPCSNGCAYADSPASIPIQRMPNISLQPNPSPTSLRDLVADVEDGLYVVGAGSWSIDQQRDNFQFGGQLFYEIKNGVIGDLVRDAVYQGRTVSFWNALDGLGDASTYHLAGTLTCGKGEPLQLAPVSHGSVPARFRGVAVLNTERGDV
jgi:TldD protein